MQRNHKILHVGDIIVNSGFDIFGAHKKTIKYCILIRNYYVHAAFMFNVWSTLSTAAFSKWINAKLICLLFTNDLHNLLISRLIWRFCLMPTYRFPMIFNILFLLSSYAITERKSNTFKPQNHNKKLTWNIFDTAM